MRRVMGLDISKTNTGWAVGDGGKPVVGVKKFEAPGGVEDDVWWQAFRWTAGMVKDHAPDVVYIEAPLERLQEGQSSAHTLIVLAQLQAAIRTCIRGLLGSPAVVVKPQTARLSFTGRGNYPKGTAKGVVKDHAIRLGWLTPENATFDKADACCVYAHGCLMADKSLISVFRPDPLFTPSHAAAPAAEVEF
jgi:hypothetical protein